MFFSNEGRQACLVFLTKRWFWWFILVGYTNIDSTQIHIHVMYNITWWLMQCSLGVKMFHLWSDQSMYVLWNICLLSDLIIWRDIIRNAVNASESDSVIFVGSGVTGAIHKLIHALDFKEPPVSTQFTALLYHLYWFLKREDIQPTPMRRCCEEFTSLMLDSCEFPFMQCTLTFTSTVCFLARKILVISDFHPVSSVGKSQLYQTRGWRFKPWPYKRNYIMPIYIFFVIFILLHFWQNYMYFRAANNFWLLEWRAHCMCCGSILSGFQILFSFVSNSLPYIIIPKNKGKYNLKHARTKFNHNLTYVSS